MAEEKKGFFKRLVSGLTKTRDNIVAGFDSIFSGFSSIDEDFYEELEEILIICGGIFAQVLYNILASILRALGNSKTPLYFLILAAVLNCYFFL